MNWIDSNSTCERVNVKDAIALIITSRSDNHYEVFLEFTEIYNHSHQRQPLRLVFRGDKKEYNTYMRGVKKALKDTWIKDVQGNFLNSEKAFGIHQKSQGDRHEVAIEFGVDKDRNTVRPVFEGDEGQCRAFINKFMESLTVPFVQTLDGGFIKSGNAIGILTRKQRDWFEVLLEMNVSGNITPLRTVFRSKDETELKAFMDDLTEQLTTEKERHHDVDKNHNRRACEFCTRH